MKPQLPSRVPFILDAFLTLITTAQADEENVLHGIQVIDGPALDLKQIENDSISVGPGTEDQPGIVTTYEAQPGLGGQAYIEVNEVALVVSSYSGEIDIKARRDRAAELLAGIKAIADVNQTAADAWDSLAFGARMEWYPVQHEGGATVDVAFSLVFRSIL